ncbi:MAG: hypothetical protein Q4G43_05845 [Mobilicoccus sp.]|nr:hypothetical protein [Mobilicoccus sp.]
MSLEDGFAPASDFRAVLSEQRGRQTFTIMRGPDGQFAHCLLSRSLLVGDGGGGGMAPIPPIGDPGADSLDLAMIGAIGPSRNTAFGISLPSDPRTANYAYGRAGADVASLVLHTRSQGDVTATLQAGLWAASWPSPDDSTDFTDVTATLTLTDGSSREVDINALALPWSD